MRVNEQFHIIKRNDDIYLTNLENGDVYELNDVALSIFELSEKVNTTQELADRVFSLYEESAGDYTKSDLIDFIDWLMENGFIRME